ncbi:ROK family protein [Pseudactinotalea sp. Z1748]|uniref:ROK family protein n=1 Tax=Pseudactinotalea sp. Z1748 TaxID=3413027 RepID=UPI003C7B1EE1
MGIVGGLDIGGTTTNAVLIQQDGKQLATGTAPTPAREGGEAMLRTATSLLSGLLADVPRSRLVAVGAGAAGVVDIESGTILASSDSFRDWTAFPLGPRLSESLLVPALVVNDVDAFCLGQLTVVRSKGMDTFMGLTIGTGIGGALVLDGSIYRGANGAAGEIGHTSGYGSEACTCGGFGHLESKASGRSIATRYARKIGEPSDLSASEVATYARRGDSRAREVFRDAGQALGQAMVTVATLLDNVNFILGGGVLHAWDLIEPGVHTEISENPPVSKQDLCITLSSMGPWAAAVGAAAAANEEFEKGVVRC